MGPFISGKVIAKFEVIYLGDRVELIRDLGVLRNYVDPLTRIAAHIGKRYE